MDHVSSLLPLAAVAIPVATAVAIVLARRAPDVRDSLLVAGAVATFVTVASMVPRVLDGSVPTTSLGELVPGFALSLRADGMGMLFALLASFLWVLASPYAIGYMRGTDERRQTRFYAFYALCLATAFGVAFAGDLFTFFVFYELLTATTYPLVTHKGNAEAIRAGRKYLGFLLSGGVLVLFAMVVVVQRTGEIAFTPGGFVGDALGPALTVVVFLLFAVGFGTKAGLMPLHPWLPAAMVAPTPVSALLHAVAVVKAGVFAFGRLIGFVFGPEVLAVTTATTLLAVVAGTTIVVASGIALRQDHLKRRLAYSTIAHLAYIVLGFALLSPNGFDGALLHIVNHGALKITLFFGAGAIYVHLHLDRVSQLDGIGRRMPVTMTAFALASLGLAGLPPMGGFASKWRLVLGAYEADQRVFAALMVGAGLLTASYLFPIVHRAFFRPLPVDDDKPAGAELVVDLPVGESGGTALATGVAPSRVRWRDASPLMVVPLAVTATLGLVLGLGDWLRITELAGQVAASVTGIVP
jgi:multicomponent Na+:H+ antiporter subunit D